MATKDVNQRENELRKVLLRIDFIPKDGNKKNEMMSNKLELTTLERYNCDIKIFMAEQLKPSVREISPEQIRGDMESVLRRFIKKDYLGKNIEFRPVSAGANADGFVVSREKYQGQVKTVVNGFCELPDTALRLSVCNIYGEDGLLGSRIETNIIGRAIPEKDLRKAAERVFRLPKKGLTWSSHPYQPCPIGENASIDVKGKLPSGESIYFSLDVIGRVLMVVRHD